MKAVRICTLLALTLIVGLGMASFAFAKKPTGPTGLPAPPGPQKSYLLCLESTTDMPAAPRARWNLVVVNQESGPMANISGQLIVAHLTTKPAWYINFGLMGTYDTQKGVIKFMGKGGGTDNAKYEVKGTIMMEPKSDKGPYSIEYKKVSDTNWSMAKGDAMTSPCVQHGALR